MSIALPLIAALLTWLLLAAAVLRTLAIARRADELADRHWLRLGRLQSESGVAFFPTIDARLELELAISEVVELERRSARRPRGRTAASLLRVAGP